MLWSKVILAAIVFLTCFCPGTALALSISHKARAMNPGEVVLISVHHENDMRSVTGRVFGREIPFFPSDTPGTWQGLIGLDLETPPGDHCAELTVEEVGGAVLKESYRFEVFSKTFPTRQMTVAGNYVDPPETVAIRIKLEAKEVSRILSHVSEERLWQGRFVPPVPGIVVSAFGKRSVFNGQPRSPHAGVDLRAASGTPLKAPGAGKVVLAKELYFAGNTIILDHGMGLYSTFGHLSTIAVSAGDEVRKGQVVGKTGETGRVSGPHLHWSVRLNRARVDPLSLLAITR